MKVRHLLLLIVQNPMFTAPKLVPAWHLEVYREKYGETIGDEPEEQLVELTELPDAEEELQRMQGIFGANPDTKQSYVDLVFGRGTRALAALEAEMQAAVVADAPKRRRVPVDTGAAVDAPADAALAALAGQHGEQDPLQ